MSGTDRDPKPGAVHGVTLPGGVAMRFRYIPPTPAEGFRMGRRNCWQERGDEWQEPVHRVRIGPGYWLGEDST